MKDWLAANGGLLRWGRLLNDGKLSVKDLPWMTAPNGAKVCWRHLLAKCDRGDQCNFHHFSQTDLSDGFCHEVCRVLKPVLATTTAKIKERAKDTRGPGERGQGGRGGGAPGRH